MIVAVSNREDGAYCTKDLMLQHPEHKNWFKYIGRMDDTLTQTLGEKTNPVPMELAIVSIMLFCPILACLSHTPILLFNAHNYDAEREATVP